jgi:hypothetical protein
MLLLDDDDELPAQPTSAEQALEVGMGSSGLTAIDEALIRHATNRWSKVARVVSDALKYGGHDPWDEATLHLYVRRVIHLVESGVLESQGNLRKPRWSEIRLNSAHTTGA